jgi:preprotein translocase subunit SecG
MPADRLNFEVNPDPEIDMFGILLTLLIIDALILSAVVLLQAGQGGGLASMGGGTTDNVMGGRQAVTILTRLSWWCGGIFLALSLLLSIVRRAPTGSDIQQRLRSGAPASAPAQLPVTSAPTTPAAGAPPAATTPPPAAPQSAAPKPAAPSPAPR